MSHLVEVDQSGHELRRRGKTGPTLYLEFFAIGLYLLLRNHSHDLEQITIDIEYPGHDATIKENLLALLLRRGVSIDAHRIRFDQIHRGKKHPGAHDKAYYTWRGTVAPDKVIRLGELLAEDK